MSHRRVVLLTACILVIGLAAPAASAFQEGASIPKAVLDSLQWRQIGPASFGGRIDDIEAVVGNPHIIFVGTASGGIFKTVNNGVTWRPVFDEEGVSLSIGDLLIESRNGLFDARLSQRLSLLEERLRERRRSHHANGR